MKLPPDQKHVSHRLSLSPMQLFQIMYIQYPTSECNSCGFRENSDDPAPPLPHSHDLLINILVQALVHHADGDVHGLRDLEHVLGDLTPQVFNHIRMLVCHKQESSGLILFAKNKTNVQNWKSFRYL